MLELFIKGRKYRTDAKAIYEEDTKKVKVLKGSVVSDEVSNFVHRESILKLRAETVDKNGVVKKDIVFDNVTAAAQYVCGYSVSGPVAWHVEKHKNLLTWIKESK